MPLRRLWYLFLLPLITVAQPALELGRPLQARSDGGRADSYKLEIKKGDYIEVLAQQTEVDVVLTLTGPDDKQLQQVNALGIGGAELLIHSCDLDGTYRIDVRPARQGSIGIYTLQLIAQRPASSHDREVAAADIALREISAKSDEPAAAWEAIADDFRRLNVSIRQAQALLLAGLRRQQQRELDEAALDYEKANTLFQTVPDLAGQSLALDYLGTLFYSSGQADKAVSQHELALVIRRQIKDRLGEAETLYHLGLAQRSLNQYDNAISSFEAALALAREVKNPALEGGPLNNLGTVYYFMGDYEKAISYYNQALVIRRAANDRTGEANTMENLASAYSLLGQYEKAIGFHDQALGIMRDMKSRAGEAAILNNLGIAYRFLSQYEKAIGYYQQALAIRRELKERSKEAEPLDNLGIAFFYQHQYDKAIDHHLQALVIHKEVKDRDGEATSLNNLGMVYNARRDFVKAVSYFDEALAINREIKDRAGEGVVLDNLGLSYRFLNQYVTAIRYFEQALVIGLEVKNRAQESEVLSDLMRTWILLKQPRAAVYYGKQAVNVIQGIRSEIRGLGKESQNAFLEGKKDTYRTLANLLITQGRLIEAQQVLNLLKEQEFFDYVRGDEASAGPSGRADLTQEESQWAKRYRAVSEVLIAKGVQIEELEARIRRNPALMDDPAIQRRHADLREDLENGNRAFQQYLEDINHHFAAAKEDTRIIDMREVEAFKSDLAEMGHGAVAVYTLVTRDRYTAILVTTRLERAYESAIGSEELARKIMTFRERIQNPRVDPRTLAEELYKIIIPAALSRDLQLARANTVIWSLDGPLRYVPIGALYDGKEYLIEKYRLAVITPASHTRLMAPPKPSWRALGFGVTRAHEGFLALPSVNAELAWVVRENPREPGVLDGRRLLDDQFTRETLGRELIKGYPVIHFASHFSFRPGDDTHSFLLLGDGRQFSLADLKTADMIFAGVDLLTLSACSTGLGDIRRSDGSEVESFGVLAQRKGAKAVVASLWPVADVSTALLMRQFYRVRQTKPALTKVEALREAQLELLHGKLTVGSIPMQQRGLVHDEGGPARPPDFRHPYFWAPFFLMGNWL